MITNDNEKKLLRDGYIEEYKRLTGHKLLCVEQKRKRRITKYQGVARKHILLVAAEYSGIPLDDIIGKSRRREIVAIRQLISFLLREMRITLTEIGRIVNSDHTTVMSTIDLLTGRMSVDKEFKAEYREFKEYCLEKLDGNRRTLLDTHQKKAIVDSYRGGGISSKELAEIYNVDQSTINRICQKTKK
jgi:predicted transcriptional regulator